MKFRRVASGVEILRTPFRSFKEENFLLPPILLQLLDITNSLHKSLSYSFKKSESAEDKSENFLTKEKNTHQKTKNNSIKIIQLIKSSK